jgi:hypothetical protein
MTSSAEGSASTGVYFHHYPPQQILHNIAEPQWLPPIHQSTATSNESKYVDDV